MKKSALIQEHWPQECCPYIHQGECKCEVIGNQRNFFPNFPNKLVTYFPHEFTETCDQNSSINLRLPTNTGPTNTFPSQADSSSYRLSALLNSISLILFTFSRRNLSITSTNRHGLSFARITAFKQLELLHLKIEYESLLFYRRLGRRFERSMQIHWLRITWKKL